MKTKLNFMFLILACCSAPLIFAEEKPLGKVASVTGQATMMQVRNGVKIKIKKGDWVYLGSMIQTGKRSSVLIEMEDKMMKLVPEDTQMMFFDSESWKIYQRTDKSIQKIFSVIGKKAASKEEAQRIKTIKEIIKTEFDQENYLKVIQMVESEKIDLTDTQTLYLAGVSYLKLGREEKSMDYFQKLLNTGSFEYRMYAQFGLFIGAIRIKDYIKAQKILDSFEEENRIAREMKDILNSVRGGSEKN